SLTRDLPRATLSPCTTLFRSVECPDWWFPVGFALLSPAVVFLMWKLFAIPIWAAILAIPLGVVMGFVAARVTGETDITPTKALRSEEHTSELQSREKLVCRPL